MFNREEYIHNGELKSLQLTLRRLIARIEVLEEDHYQTHRMVAMLLDNFHRRLTRAES
jgi:hypothetical protein